MINVTVFNEFLHERTNETVKKIYPAGIHGQIATFLKCDDINVRTVTLFNENGDLVPECGLTEEVLKDTDVLIWWGHAAHDKVPDEVAQRVADQVLCGMGAIFLHSAHHSKPFKKLMGTTCNLAWREEEQERLWNINPAHPIMAGISDYIDLPQEELYGERFEIPAPDEILMLGAYSGFETFRSACTWQRVNGKIFYFQPGHETFPTYHIEEIKTIIKNAVRWATPTYRAEQLDCPMRERIEFNK